MKVITIGRGQDNDFVINSPAVSRYNTQIIKSDDGSYTIIDMGSANGTYVNGVRINGERSLSYSDKVIIANVAIDWVTLFQEEQPHLPAESGRMRVSWVLPVILGAVSFALIIGVAIILVMFKKHKAEDAQTISELEKANSEIVDEAAYEKMARETQIGETDGYREALIKSRGETAKEKAKLSEMQKEAEDKERQAAEKLSAAEKRSEELTQEIQSIKKEMTDEISSRDISLAELEKLKDSLEMQLNEEVARMKKLQEDYEYVCENVELFWEAMSGAPHADICKQLKFDYTGRDPKDVLFEKFREGKDPGEIIIRVAEQMKSKLNAE